MLTTLLAIMAVIALLCLIIFHYNVLWCLLLLVLSAGGLVLKVLFLKKNKKFEKLILFILCFAGLIPLSCMKNVNAGKLEEYMDAVTRIECMILDGDSKAEKELQKLEKEYGSNDTITGLYAYLAMSDDDPEEAYELMNSCENRHSEEYYSRMEYLYRTDLSLEAEDSFNKIYNLYMEAAKELPAWDHAQQMAGVLLYEKKEYAKAGYYLSMADRLSEGDPLTLFYLGAVSFELGDLESCLRYFEEALDNDAPVEIQSGIAEYIDRIE